MTHTTYAHPAIGFTADEILVASNPELAAEQTVSILSAHREALLNAFDSVDSEGLFQGVDDREEAYLKVLQSGLHWVAVEAAGYSWPIEGTSRVFVTASLGNSLHTAVTFLLDAAELVPAFGEAVGLHGRGVNLT